jgi:hypothetical protein
VNISNRIYYKKELAKTIENLESPQPAINESVLDDLQAKIYSLMKQKYYPEFKNYPELHKILLKSDFLFKNSSPTPPQPPQQQQLSLASPNTPESRSINDMLINLDEDFDSGSLNECVFESCNFFGGRGEASY